MYQNIFVTVSYAQSLDGRTATKTGDSQWISGEETLVLAQELRRDNQAIAVGIGTVLRDDPLLTCRIAENADPLRVVFDGGLRIPVESKIVKTAKETPTIVFHNGGDLRKNRELTAAGVETIEIPRNGGGLDIRQALGILSERGNSSLFVEGGSALVTSFIREGLADRLVCVIAPLIIGKGIEGIGDLGIELLGQARRLEPRKVYQLGRDVVWELDFNDE